jgi:hypothetical protein
LFKLLSIAAIIAISLNQVAFAQNADPNVAPITRSLVDHTRLNRLLGSASTDSGNSNEFGATYLPYTMPENATYVNRAPYPLTVSGPGEIAVNGVQRISGLYGVRGATNRLVVSTIVPAGGSFSSNFGMSAMAMANNATWQQTQIRFVATSSSSFLNYRDSGCDAGTGYVGTRSGTTRTTQTYNYGPSSFVDAPYYEAYSCAPTDTGGLSN